MSSSIHFGTLNLIRTLVRQDSAGLASCRSVFASKPLTGRSIVVDGNKTPQIIELAFTLRYLGAEVTHHSDSSAQYAIAYTSAPDFIIDYLGKATPLILLGVEAEKEFKRTGNLPDWNFIVDHELLSMLEVIKAGLITNPNKYHEIKNKLIGVCDMTTWGVKKAYVMQANGTLPFPVVNVKGSIANSKFGDLEGLDASICDVLKAQDVSNLRNHLNNHGLSGLLNFNRYNLLEEAKLNFNIHHHLPEEAQLPDGYIIEGKVVVVCGYGDKGRCAAAAMRGAGARVFVTEIDPCRAYLAVKEKFKVCNLEDVVQKADVIIAATGKKGTIMVSDMKKMKDNMIVMDIGHFDNEIDMAGLESCSSVQKISTRHGFICYFPETKNAIRVLVLPDSEPTSYTHTMGVIGLLALQGAKDIEKYKKEVCVLSKDYDEMVAALHLEQLGAKLTKGSTSCTSVALDGQEYLRKRKASLMNRLALPEMKFKCA